MIKYICNIKTAARLVRRRTRTCPADDRERNKAMKVLMINGSPRANGNTQMALEEIGKVFEKNGVEYEIVSLSGQKISGCMACGACAKLGRCVMDDMVNEIAPKLRECDGFVVGTPVYYASANGTLISLLDRLFRHFLSGFLSGLLDLFHLGILFNLGDFCIHFLSHIVDF